MAKTYDTGDEWRRERPDIYGYKDGKMDIEREQVRGTGRTTAQLKDAPKGAVYICKNDGFHDVVKLAHYMNRSDLHFCKVQHIEHLRGTKAYIVVDHAVDLTEEQKSILVGCLVENDIAPIVKPRQGSPRPKLLREVLETGMGEELDNLGYLLKLPRQDWAEVGLKPEPDQSYRDRLRLHNTVRLLLTYCGL